VADIVFLYRRGYPPERIQEEYSQLNLAQVHAALSYYHTQPEEIESVLQEDQSSAEELDREWEDYVRRHGGHPPNEPAPENRHIAKPVGWRPKE
jgi:hypothetical protein